MQTRVKIRPCDSGDGNARSPCSKLYVKKITRYTARTYTIKKKMFFLSFHLFVFISFGLKFICRCGKDDPIYALYARL